MGDFDDTPCPAACRGLDLILSAARRQELARTALTEAERDRHDISAEMQRFASTRALAEVKGEADD